MHQPTPKETDNRLLINVLLLALMFLILLNFYFVYQMRGAFKAPPVQAPPLLPKVELTIITAPDCKNCFNIDAVASFVKSKRINLTSERNLSWKDPAATILLAKHGITSAPTIILSGETENLFIEQLTKSGSGLALTTVPPPYVDTKTGTVAGLTTMTIISPDKCDACFNISIVAEQIQNAIAVSSQQVLSSKDPAAKKLMSTYNISKVPALILSKDAELYQIVNRSWDQLGSREADGTLVLRNAPPPYQDPRTGAVKGLVTLTYLADAACTECYNVSIHRMVLGQMGLAVGKEESIDVSSSKGKEIAATYNISQVPTIILSKDAGDYPLLNQVWPQVGTIERDGSHVFRVFEALGRVQWKDLRSGKMKGVPTVVFNATSNATTVEGQTPSPSGSSEQPATSQPATPAPATQTPQAQASP